MTENKSPLDNWIKDIVAFHKTKRKFVNLKDMETEDAAHFLICEFNGYDFEILAVLVQDSSLLELVKSSKASVELPASLSLF